jgi:hypothetical protein
MRQTTVVLLFILAGVLFASWFLTTHEKVRETEYTGFTGEARVNQFLAAEMLLNEVGIESGSITALEPSDWLPTEDDTLVLHASDPLAIGEERDLLVAWVSGGGHLVLLPPAGSSAFAEGLHNQFGFAFVDNEADERDADTGTGDDGNTDDDNSGAKNNINKVVPEYDYTLDLEYSFRRLQNTFDESPSASLSDAEGIIAARREWGGGYVTAFADARYFYNESIDELDHARLLLDTVDGHISPGKVWFVFDAAFPSLWQLIWENASYVVIGLAMALVLWLWSRMPAFGPAMAPESMERRSIMEHVRAAGNFAWRNRATADLIASSTAAIMRESEFRHPGIGRLSLENQAQRIARLTDMPVEVVFDALGNQHVQKHRDFTRLMKTLQQIRKGL